VARGRLGISSGKEDILLELDPEGSAYCVLVGQDVIEIADILASESRSIWEASDRVMGRPAQVDGDPNTSCRLTTETGTLQATVHESRPLVAIAYDSGTHCRMDVAQAVALVQILQRMAATVADRAP
jgi:hypothetical protein